MGNIYKYLIAVFLVIHLDAYSQKLPWRLNEKQIVVHAPDKSEAEKAISVIEASFEAGYNISYEPANGAIRCYVTPEELNYLTGKGLNVTVEVDDLNAHSASFAPGGVPNGYYTVAQLNEIADSLAVNFPEICTLMQIGTNVMQDPIYVLKISDNVTTDENEPEVMFDGGIHGDEVGGPENLIRFARDLCLEYGVNSEITEAVNNAEIWIVYCLNPYGRANMTRYNPNGVDINRDYGYMWDSEGGSLSSFSQAESKIIRDFLRVHQTVIHISYHSGTEFISYPWSYREDLTPDNPNHDYLANQYASNSGYSNIPLGAGYNGMYPINGSSKDFGYGATGSISWSMEISLSKQPPASQIVPYYLKNKGAMLSMVTNAFTEGIHGMVTDSTSGDTLAATIFIGDFFPVTTLAGDYHKFLVPGIYNIRIESPGYQPKEINNVAISAGIPVNLDVQLVKGEGYFAQSVVSCYIPNNNSEDEGFTPGVIGTPDDVSYSIGRFGSIIIDMGVKVLNRTGYDLKVYEGGATPEGYKVYGSSTPDGPWHQLGEGTGTGLFDLSATMLPAAQYFKIADDGDGSSYVPDAGFDLDAVENLHPDTLTVGWISGFTYANFPTYYVLPGTEVYVNGSEVISDENGAFIIASPPGEMEIEASISFFGAIDTVFVTLGDTLIHDMYLDVWESAENYPTTSFSLFPVPADDQLRIKGTEGHYLVEIFNSKGNMLLRKDVMMTDDEFVLNTTGLHNGLYIIRLSGSGIIHSRKFVVRH